MFLISPSASNIYKKKLKYHQDEEFLKSFTRRSFTTKSFTTHIPSDLSGRVICLNYQFAKIFPFLKDGYLKHLIEAEELKNKANYKGSEEQIASWKGMLRHYADCEYMDKVEEGINQIGLDRLISDDWKFSFEICFKGLLHSLISNDDDVKLRWSRYFEEVAKVFSIDQFTFQPSLGGPSASFPPHIELELRSSHANISAYDLAEYLQENILPIILQKLKITPDKKSYKINEFLDRINALKSYLRSWRGDGMTFDVYYRKRSRDHLYKIEDLRNRVNQFLNFQRDETGQRHVRDLIETIETLELLKIYGADTLKGDFSLTRLIGHLSTHN
jgi:hypothetical protein